MNKSSVLYYCPCYKSPADLVKDEEADEQEQLSLADPRVARALFPLERLYFCEDCRVHRCPRCVLEEVVITYCPSCLYEGSEGRHTCARNCFACPQCESTTKTVGNDDAGYALQCVYCKWNTRDAGLSLGKPTSLMKQIQAQRPDGRTFAFDKVRRMFEHEQARQREQEDMNTMLHLYQRAMTVTEDRSYRPVKVDDDGPVDLTVLQKDNMPQQVRLVSKWTKRCRQCRFLLIRPEAKSSSIHLRSRMFAHHFVPRLDLDRREAGRPEEHVVRVTNPREMACRVTLSTANQTPRGDTIVVLCPEVRIGATETNTFGIHARTHNSVSVILEITPSPTAANRDEAITFAVFIQVTYDAGTDGQEQDYGCWVVMSTRLPLR